MMKLGGRESKGNRTQMASFKFEVIFLFTQNREENNNNNNNKKLYQEEVVVYLVCVQKYTLTYGKKVGGFCVQSLVACVFDKPTSIPVGCSSFFPLHHSLTSRKVKSLSQSRESFDFSALETQGVYVLCSLYKLHTYTHTHTQLSRLLLRY
jgi:hypothetical protein